MLAACNDENADGFRQLCPPVAKTERLFNVIKTGAAANPARISRRLLSDKLSGCI
jgi:hypothetical protein